MTKYLLLGAIGLALGTSAFGCGPAKRTCTPEINACMQRCGEDSPEADRSNALPPQADTRGPCRTACEDRYCR